MSYLNFKSKYDKEPETVVTGYDNVAYQGYDNIAKAILNKNKNIIVVDCYPGVNDDEILSNLKKYLDVDIVIESKDIFYDKDEINKRMQTFLTEDRVRGVMYYGTILDFIDQDKLENAKNQIKNSQKRILVYGFGASLITTGDVLVYADMARWEIQLRYRKGMTNFKTDNSNDEFLAKYKRGFFIEWRIADKHKKQLYDKIDLYLDTNEENVPKAVEFSAMKQGLKELTKKPFRLVPYFDPGVWGGQWMKEVCNLDASKPNYAWSFDGVPEENSLFLRFGDIRIETPAMNLVQMYPKTFLGEKNYARFGAEFPIRFDLLDTMDGQNLSLQVHPTTEYIKDKFGMPYTQDESYYILDAKEDGGVYLGFKENIDKEQFINDLKSAQAGEISFPAEKYVNLWPAKKHDHFLIPAGTIHCSSKNAMVLEVSATPYIFTFKLWDWDRVDLNGVPRPIHLEDGEKVLQYYRDTQWVRDNLINCFELQEENQDFTKVKTGLHELEFIETCVYTSKTEIRIKSDSEVAQLNIVEGQSALVKSANNAFEPLEVHYAESFIIPAGAGDVIITPKNPCEEIKVLMAKVRF